MPLTLANYVDIFALCLCCISNVEQYVVFRWQKIYAAFAN